MAEPPSRPKHKLRVPRAQRGPVRVLVGTRKGAFAIEGDAERSSWEVRPPWHLGSTCFHLVADPRRSGTLLAAVRDPSGLPTVMISEDSGERWAPADEPPAFPPHGAFDRAIQQVFWLSPGHAFEPQSWYCGTSPQGLFRSADGGRTWSPVEGLHDHSEFDDWTSLATDTTPDGPKLHSVIVDPRSPDAMIAAMSSGGVVTSDDGGATWSRLDGGLEGDEARDPHCVVAAPTNPDRLWMQSHFGVFRMDREDGGWRRTGPRAADGTWSDAGFPIAVHPHDPDVAWVVPMDPSERWTRASVDGRPAVYRTTDAGETWERQDAGLPRSDTWWTVKRQCLATDGHDPLGLYFGTSTGEVWASNREGARWKCIARGLPHVYSVEIG